MEYPTSFLSCTAVSFSFDGNKNLHMGCNNIDEINASNVVEILYFGSAFYFVVSNAPFGLESFMRLWLSWLNYHVYHLPGVIFCSTTNGEIILHRGMLKNK